MKTHLVTSGALRTLLLVAIVSGLITVTQVAAQTATSTEPAVEEETSTTLSDATIASTTDAAVNDPVSTTTPVAIDAVLGTSTSTEAATSSDATATATDQESTAAEIVMPTVINTDNVLPNEPEPQGLTKVKIIGIKFVDYFTDGTNEFSFPGDPHIDARLANSNATLPTHEGLTWVHTTSHYLYDTASGDLEEGQYALQPNGRYNSKSLPFVSSTSTPETVGEVLGASTSAEPTPAATISTSSPSEAPASASTTPVLDTTVSSEPAPSTNSSSTPSVDTPASEPSPTDTNVSGTSATTTE